MGSRYGGLKQCDALGPSGETLLEYAIFDAMRAGFKQVVFVIRLEFEKDFRVKILDRLPQKIRTALVFQGLEDLPPKFSVPQGRLKPWGTAHAVLAARDVIRNPFVVINADDYYGPQPLRLLGDFLRQNKSDARFALVGFRLANTLSAHGAVSRGVCKVNLWNRLQSLTEHRHIERTRSGIVSVDKDGNRNSISGRAITSMNLFGFTPLYFERLKEQFPEFLRDHSKDLKAEFALPTSVNALVADGQVSLNVLKTRASWFGVTHAEDRESARKEIALRIARGLYPKCLWSDF